MNDLKPCPFCNGKASHWGYGHTVGCDTTTCGVKVWRPTEVEAIAAWNRRAPASDATPTPTPVASSDPLEADGPTGSTVVAPLGEPGASLAVTVKEQSGTDIYATVEAFGWLQYDIAATRDREGQDWDIRVTHPDGGRLYNGPWHYSATKDAKEVIAEAIRGAHLDKCPCAAQPEEVLDMLRPESLKQLQGKLRYMGKQYGAGRGARGGAQQKHYLEEAADELERLFQLTITLGQQIGDLRNVVQAACIGGVPSMAAAWEKYFPDHPISIKADHLTSSAKWLPIGTRPMDGTRYLEKTASGYVRLVRQADPDDRLPIGDASGECWPDLPVAWTPLPVPTSIAVELGETK